MKSASVPMKAHLAGDCTTISTLYKIVRKDGTAFYFTDHDRDIIFGGHTYEAAVGGLSQTAQQTKSDLSPDNQEATAFIDSDSIKEADLRYGIWDAADVEIRWINWDDVSMDAVKMRKGQLGNISMKNGVLTAEVLGLNNRLQVLLGRSFGPSCDAELGDARCKAVVPIETGTVNTNPSVGLNDAHHITPNSGLVGEGGGSSSVVLAGRFTVANPTGTSVGSQSGVGTSTGPAGTVAISEANQVGANTTYTFTLSSGIAPIVGQSIVITNMDSDSNDNGTFVIASVVVTQFAEKAGYYDDGIVTFIAGGNSGLSFQVGTWDGITLSLKNALFVAPANGDAFHISPGCAHDVSDCQTKFGNLVNHRGFPTIPGQDSILAYPDITNS